MFAVAMVGCLVLWLFVVVFEMGLWWFLRLVCGDGGGFFFFF